MTRGDSILNAPWTVRSSLNWAHSQLRNREVGEARWAAETLLAHALGVDRFQLYLRPERAVDPSQMAAFQSHVAQRCQGIPLQHLMGSVSFMGYPLRVNRAALIPRFETESLVERASGRLPATAPSRFLDAGTGSGAIAIALAKLCPQARGVALDRSGEALELAQENARSNQVEDQLTFVCSDWFTCVEGTFELIVSNPPYVPSGEIERLAVEVRDHDPHGALDGGADGLEALRTLVEQAPPYLKDRGWVVFEVGCGQAPAVQAALQEKGFDNVGAYEDLNGVERIVEAQWEG